MAIGRGLSVLVAMFAVLLVLFGAYAHPASAAVGPETRVRASTGSIEPFVGPPQAVSAGQGRGSKLSYDGFVVATGVAAEGATADAAKFSNYVFKEGATHGKDAIFRSYGYGAADSDALAAEFQAQGAAQYRAGNYTLGKVDEYGQRVTIPIRLAGQGAAAGRATTINTGWMVESDGSIRLLTPFAGFAP